MLDELQQYIARQGLQLRDALDVLLVYYLFYRALVVLKGTRAMQVGGGIALVFVLYALAQHLQLVTVLNILDAVLKSAPLVIVVLFQNDIRRGLMRMGSWFGASKAREIQALDEVVEAATELARHRIGAIITFEQDANLDEFVGTHKGHDVDAAVSRELLVSIFIPEAMNKLHDGAVIIRNLRIAKAGVFFPMPEGRVADESFGSRHRAALGITEETDAVVVVVSEERGSISFCFNGNIVSNLDGPGLRRALTGVFAPKVAKAKKRRVAPPRAELPLRAEAAPDAALALAARREEPDHAESSRRSDASPADAAPVSVRVLERAAGSAGPAAEKEPAPVPLRKPRSDRGETDSIPGVTTSAPMPQAAPLKAVLRPGDVEGPRPITLTSLEDLRSSGTSSDAPTPAESKTAERGESS